jgi:hypothetical protein
MNKGYSGNAWDCKGFLRISCKNRCFESHLAELFKGSIEDFCRMWGHGRASTPYICLIVAAKNFPYFPAFLSVESGQVDFVSLMFSIFGKLGCRKP